MNLPTIFVKVRDSTFGIDAIPSFYKQQDDSLYYQNVRKVEFDPESRQKFIDNTLMVVRQLLETAL